MIIHRSYLKTCFIDKYWLYDIMWQKRWWYSISIHKICIVHLFSVVVVERLYRRNPWCSFLLKAVPYFCILRRTSVCVNVSVSVSIFVSVCYGSDIKGDSEEGDMWGKTPWRQVSATIPTFCPLPFFGHHNFALFEISPLTLYHTKVSWETYIVEFSYMHASWFGWGAFDHLLPTSSIKVVVRWRHS